MRPNSPKQASLVEDDRLLDFTYEKRLVPNGSRNILAQPDAAWQNEAVASLTVHDDGSSAQSAFKRYRVYQYGVTQKEAVLLNDRDEAIIESDAYRLNGRSTCTKLKPGHVFRTKQHKDKSGKVRDDVELTRPDLDDVRFVVLDTQHQANVAGSYSNSFSAATATGHVIAHDPHKNRMGSVYGRVVSTDGSVEAVHKHRLMERKNFCSNTKDFYFSDEHNIHTCKGVYVAFPGLDMNKEKEPVWIKLAEHMQSVPEEGATVLVGRSSDDTNVPEIQSVVQQQGNKTILPPGGTSESTSVGNMYSTSYGDSCGIRYGNHSKVNLDEAIKHLDKKKKRAQLKKKPFKDLSYSLGASYSYSAPDTPGDSSGLLSESVSYGSTKSEHHGDLSESTSNIGTSNSTSTVGTSNSTNTVGTSNSTSKVDVSISESMTGFANSASMIGASFSESLTGANTAMSVTGANTSISATGAETSISATGVATRISATGATVNISALGVDAVDISYLGGARVKKGALEADVKALELQMIEVLKVMM